MCADTRYSSDCRLPQADMLGKSLHNRNLTYWSPFSSRSKDTLTEKNSIVNQYYWDKCQDVILTSRYGWDDV